MDLRCQITHKPLVWQEPTAKKYITENGGSKAGITQFVQDKVPNLIDHLPTNSTYLEPSGNLERFLDGIDFSKPKIIRACHPYDFAGMVDVLPSKVANDRFSAQRIIENIFERANTEPVTSFMKHETGEDFDGKVGILIQDFQGYKKGSIVEEPHDPGVYRIVTLEDRDRNQQPEHSNQFFDANGRQINQFCFRGKNGKPIDEKFYLDESAGQTTSSHDIEFRKHLPAVIGLYRSIRDYGAIPLDHSFLLIPVLCPPVTVVMPTCNGRMPTIVS